jgi:uncharacterized protein YndB with AHSA1/START domain
MTNSDRIEKKVILRAPRARVWRALSNAAEFGEWFRVKLAGDFREGTTIVGQITYPGYEHLQVEMLVDKLEPERYFAYRWRPNAVDQARDYSSEPMTLVEFVLGDAEGGTLLTITESGFDQLPEGRRAEAFRSNDQGWATQAKNIEQYVSKS